MTKYLMIIKYKIFHYPKKPSKDCKWSSLNISISIISLIYPITNNINSVHKWTHAVISLSPNHVFY